MTRATSDSSLQPGRNKVHWRRTRAGCANGKPSEVAHASPKFRFSCRCRHANSCGTTAAKTSSAPGRRPSHSSRSVISVPSSHGSTMRSCSQTRWLAMVERSTNRRPGSISTNVTSSKSTGTTPNKSIQLRNDRFPSSTFGGVRSSIPRGKVMRNQGLSSRATPCTEVQLAHTSAGVAAKRVEMSNRRVTCRALSAEAEGRLSALLTPPEMMTVRRFISATRFNLPRTQAPPLYRPYASPRPLLAAHNSISSLERPRSRCGRFLAHRAHRKRPICAVLDVMAPGR